MTDEAKNRFDAWISVTTIIGSIIAFAFTICTWQEQNHIKRADFLENKIKEFTDTSTLIARAIVDKFAVPDTTNIVAAAMTAQELINIGSSRDNVASDIKMKTIGETLNRPLPDTSISRQKVRLSFDRLLDFFGKLDYYLDLKLMTKSEVKYFEYYIKKCADEDGVLKYARENEFEGFLSLIKMLGLSKEK